MIRILTVLWLLADIAVANTAEPGTLTNAAQDVDITSRMLTECWIGEGKIFPVSGVCWDVG
jgi:hypothetical protein